jgi:hypothetical protein
MSSAEEPSSSSAEVEADTEQMAGLNLQDRVCNLVALPSATFSASLTPVAFGEC